MSGRCPSCGAAASGKFCGQCGAALRAPACVRCGAQVAPGSRFCGNCGAPAGGGAATIPAAARAGDGWRTAVPFAVAGAAVLILVLVLAFRGQPSAPAQPQAEAPFASGGTGTPPDLSQMSPREAFDRLFTRVMTASENGDTATANRFMPMALMAYRNLDAVDIDARYDVALIMLHGGDIPGARTLADTIQAEDPRHLFGFVLRAGIARFEGQAAAAREAYRGFLAAADEELRKNRPEYEAHRSMLESFRQTAATEAK